METPLQALWVQIERMYGPAAKDLLKAFYDERNRAYQQSIRDKEKSKRVRR